MPVPALTNGPWTFNVNNIATGDTYIDIGKRGIFEIKNVLKAFAAWSVIASSDSISVKNIGDGGELDLWTVYTGIVYANAGSPHSWIILQNSANGEQVCLDVATVNAARMNVVYSATGTFQADGTTTNRPTDTESVTVYSVSYNLIPTDAQASAVHAMMSADNKCTRIFWTTRGDSKIGSWFLCLEEMYGTPAVWTGDDKRLVYRPNVSTGGSDSPSGQDPRSTYIDSTAWQAYLKDASPYEGWNAIQTSCECYKGYSTLAGDPFYRLDRNQDWSGGYPVSPIGFFRENAVRGGAIGTVKDMYLAPHFQQSLSTYDGDTDREWIKLGALLVPWNGSVPTYLDTGML